MNKRIKFLLYIFCMGIGLAFIQFVLVLVLKQYGLMFREWVRITFFVIMYLLGVALTIGIVNTLVKVFSLPQEQKRKKIIQKVISVSGIIVTLSCTVVLGIFALFQEMFLYEPEHVAVKYDQKMVAYVSSFLEVSVKYHEYKNFIVCGYDVIGNEWYGSGGYDPFIRKPTPKPKTYKFYDTQGNLIAQSEEKTISQENSNSIVIEKRKAPVFPPEKMQCNFDNSDVKSSCQMSYSVDGQNWEIINIGYHYQFSFENTSYLIFSYDWASQHEVAAVYKSIDSGKNWSFVSNTPTDKILQNAEFFDENTGILEYGIVGTNNYTLYVTIDGANTFKEIILPIELQGKTDKIKDYIREDF